MLGLYIYKYNLFVFVCCFVGSLGGCDAPGYDVKLWPMNLHFAESTARLAAHPQSLLQGYPPYATFTPRK